MARQSRISPKAPTKATGGASAASRPIRRSAQRAAAKALPENAPQNALVPVRARQDGWTPERQRAFLEALADTGCVDAAAKSVGMTRQSAWRLRRRSDARAFDLAWDAALERAMQQLVSVALERAINGSVRQRWYHGQLIAEERVHHDGLLRHLLERGHAMLGTSRERNVLRAGWEKGLDALEQGRPIAPAPLPQYKIWPDPRGGWLTNAPIPPGYRGRVVEERGEYAFRNLTAEEVEAYNRKQARIEAYNKVQLDRFWANL
ncbi:MAG: hypothetical protein KKD64_09185 [Alphaproteobacteria bacterium]|nr:hypothetical protein [Alphaproteobacteria bacterium]MBU0793245.1 hypothetical protein [Alphaproteobacteria bacterium]MBU0874502.1 hypothetical protein [Alphaproteobacteria bacterium]MBU1769815.1 hypothetical protein [Alphaproteobacteria bacterium]